VLSEKILFGEMGAGELVLIDATGEGSDAHFTFTSTPIASTPDTPEDLQEAPTS
jgi:ATP-dependent Clp protease ATP-binding subunit ClpC